MSWASRERRHPCLPPFVVRSFLLSRQRCVALPGFFIPRKWIMADNPQRTRERKKYEPFLPPRRVLLGPGPSPVEDRVLAAMSAPVLGHLDPLFLRCMDDIQEMLRYVYETDNRVTVPISATGSAGMEAALVNIIEPGDQVVVCIHGVFGERML